MWVWVWGTRETSIMASDSDTSGGGGGRCAGIVCLVSNLTWSVLLSPPFFPYIFSNLILLFLTYLFLLIRLLKVVVFKVKVFHSCMDWFLHDFFYPSPFFSLE